MTDRDEVLDLLLSLSDDRITLVVGGAWITGVQVGLTEWLDTIGQPGPESGDDDDAVYLVDVVATLAPSDKAQYRLPALRVSKASINAFAPFGLTTDRK